MTKATILALCILAFSVHAQILSSNQVETITRAIYISEGGTNAQWLYGIRSVKYKDAADAKRICENSVRKNYARLIASGRTNDFIPFMSRIYCPLDSNNWARNVSWWFRKLSLNHA